MIYTKTIYRIKGQFEGIYRWGVGFIRFYQMCQWERFWGYHRGTHWSCFNKSEAGQSLHYLVSTYGSCYLHPDCFNLVLEDPSESVLRELKEICNKCAFECEGTFKMEYTKHIIEVDDSKTLVF